MSTRIMQGPFHSILWRTPQEEPPTPQETQPDYFRDLNLDQIVQGIVRGRQEYVLDAFFAMPLASTDAVRWRQAIMQDLEGAKPRAAFEAFAAAMRQMRAHRLQAGKCSNLHARRRWLLDAALVYVAAVEQLDADMLANPPKSLGLQALAAHWRAYAQAKAFCTMAADARRILADLGALRYTIHIDGQTVTVRAYADEPDYSVEVAHVFERFARDAAHAYAMKFSTSQDLNHVEAQILDRVALLFPEVFGRLDVFCLRYAEPVPPFLARFDREVQFYLAYLSYACLYRTAGLHLCYPELSQQDKQVQAQASFDMALARQQIEAGAPVVTNDFALQGDERMFVVSGPNHGGKTTFARTFGQLHHLASLGCPVAASQAKLFLFDRLFTHFERVEVISNHRGKLQEDLVRVHDMLDAASSASIFIMNETFSSTTVDDAVALARKVMQRMSERDIIGVFVTFLTELASFDARTVSMVSTVEEADPTIRTFKVVRKFADGKSYAMALAEKYRVTREHLLHRIAP